MAGVRSCGSIATRCEGQGTTFRSERNFLRMERLMNNVLSSKLRASCGAIPNHTRVCKSLRRSCRSHKLSNPNGCLIAVRRDGRLFCFLRFAPSRGISSGLTKFMPTPVSRRHMDVFITVVGIPYDHQSVYDNLDVRATPIGVGANSEDLGLSATARLGHVIGNWFRR